MPSSSRWWVATVAGLSALDWFLDRRHDGSTLSETTRFLFRTHTGRGRTAFTVTFMGGGYVLHRHIIKGVHPTWVR